MTLRILAFNTVTELCSVSVLIDHKIYSNSVLSPKKHAEKILPMIDQLLIDTGVSLKSLDCIVFDQGPGSFVGLRIGINIAQGLALGANLPLIGVSSLEILAQGAWRTFSSKRVLTTINAGTNKLYCSCYLYDMNNSIWVCKRGMSVLTTEIVQEIICMLTGTWAIVGTGWQNNQVLRSCIESTTEIVIKRTMYPDAQDMLLLGLYAYKEKKFLHPNQVSPIYINTNLIK